MFTPEQIAIKAAKEAGKKLLDLAKSKVNYQLKSSHDILAEADLISEEIILKKIKTVFPTHSFLSEEKGMQGKSDYLWVIDPLDGTINFSRNIDEYCISIALLYKSTLELGVIYQPSKNKLYLAQKGKGAYLNNKKIRVSKENKPINSLLATDNTSKLDLRLKDFKLMTNLSLDVRQVRIFGSGALHLAGVAQGNIDIYFKSRLNFWDFAAGVLLIQEAGGVVTDFEGRQISENSENIVASNGLIHNKILELIQKKV